MQFVESRSKALWYALASAFAFAVMGGFVKLAADVAVLDKVVFRNLVSLVVALVIVLRNRRPILGSRSNQLALMGRSLLGIGGVMCYFWAIDRLLLADAAMLAKLSPFFVTVFAAVFLGERLSVRIAVALMLGFAGGLLVIKPQIDLEVVPALIGSTSAVFAGGAYVLLRYLRDREPPETIVLHFSLVSVVGLLPFMLASFDRPTLTEWFLLLGIGLSAAAGQLTLTASYRYGPAGQVSLISYATIVFSALFGWFWWAEVPDTLSIAGGLLILAGGLVAFSPTRTPSSVIEDRR
jgi:drug/metabolite transporter (DMT)-like permease